MPDGHGPLTDALPLLLTGPVQVRDGVQHLHLGEGRSAPLRFAGGEPVTRFVPGWSPDVLYSGAAPLLILEFVREDGSRSAWLLDADLCRLGDTLATLTPEQQAQLCARTVPILRRMMADILIPATPVLSPEAAAFLRINEDLRVAIAQACTAGLLPSPRLRLLGEIEERIALPHAQPAAALSRAHLEAGFAVAFEDRLVRVASEGMLSWPSPIDARPLRCQGCVYIDDFRFAFRFADPAANLAFYVIAADHYFKPLGVYVPALDLLLVRDGWCKHLIEVFFPPDLTHWLVREVARNAAALVPSLTRGASRIASIMRGPPGTHLGHQLWNELSGIEYLLTTAGAGAGLAEWIVPAAREGVELWAPTDKLFPELHGRVRRDLDQGGAVAPYLYAHDICAVRATRERVSAELRRRLQEISMAGPAGAEIRPQAERARARQAPVIVLGLRVENRTLVDLTAFFSATIRLVAQLWPGATLVIDGHNSADGGSTIESHGEKFARRSPLQVEREIAAELRTAAAGLDVVIVDTLGASMATSLVWAQLSDCFMSIWGASLAKFRWVCNKPGLVITSRDNLLERMDLHIYDSPQYMETPARLVFVDPASVVDDPEAPLLAAVAVGNRFYSNFRVDHGRVLSQFRALVNEVMTGR